MRVKIRSEKDLYNWLFEQTDVAPNAAAAEKAKDIIDTKKVSDVVKKLDSADKATVDIFKKGLEDNDPSDDKVATEENVPRACSSLYPTQNEISLMKSVGYPLSSFKSLQNVASGDPTGKGQGIIVSGQFIIDGHHRWSSIAAIAGPTGKVLVKDVAFPGATADEKLVKAQIAIAAKVGTPLPKAPGSGEPDNILGSDAASITNMINSNLGRATETGAPMLNPEYLTQVLASSEGKTYFGLKGTETPEQAKQMIISKVAENLSKLNKPQGEAPARVDMPQFDPKVGGPKFDDVKSDLAAGSINLQNPLIESRVRRIHLPGIRRR